MIYITVDRPIIKCRGHHYQCHGHTWKYSIQSTGLVHCLFRMGQSQQSTSSLPWPTNRWHKYPNKVESCHLSSTNRKRQYLPSVLMWLRVSKEGVHRSWYWVYFTIQSQIHYSSPFLVIWKFYFHCWCFVFLWLFVVFFEWVQEFTWHWSVLRVEYAFLYQTILQMYVYVCMYSIWKCYINIMTAKMFNDF